MIVRSLLKAVVVAVLALILFGFLPGTKLIGILVLFTVWRFSVLLMEALRKPHDGELFKPSRNRKELFAEMLGAVSFALLLPIDAALHFREFVSFRESQGVVGVAIVTLFIFLYFLPRICFKSSDFELARTLWWSSPFLPALFFFGYQIETKHPYLNILRKDHERLAAERVLSLKDNVQAAYHVDWVLRYARQLDQQGFETEAIPYYREALRRDSNNREIYKRLATLEGRLLDEPLLSKPIAANAPLWESDDVITNASRGEVGLHLQNVGECTVVIVPIGDVRQQILDAIAYSVAHELQIPVFVATNSIQLPPHDRIQGVVTGRQWESGSLVKAMMERYQPFPSAPIKYAIVTNVDIYGGEAHYVFSATYNFGAVVSLARFEDQGNQLLRHRAAKQTLCALLKSFRVPISTDRNCVTSYTRSLSEFDLKGNRPNVETLALFRQTLDKINSEWQSFKTRGDQVKIKTP